MRDDRQQCYAELRKIMADACAEYYRAHPEWLGDRRSEEGLQFVILPAIAKILALLDQYEIVRK